MDLKIEFCNENQMYAIDAYPLLNVKQEVITIYMQRTDTRPAMMRCSCITGKKSRQTTCLSNSKLFKQIDTNYPFKISMLNLHV